MNPVSVQQEQLPQEYREATPSEVTLGTWRDNWNAWVNKYIQPGIREGYFDLSKERTGRRIVISFTLPMMCY